MLTGLFAKAVIYTIRMAAPNVDRFAPSGDKRSFPPDEKSSDDIANILIYLLLIPVAFYLSFFVSSRRGDVSPKVLTYAVIFADPLAYLVSSAMFL